MRAVAATYTLSPRAMGLSGTCQGLRSDDVQAQAVPAILSTFEKTRPPAHRRIRRPRRGRSGRCSPTVTCWSPVSSTAPSSTRPGSRSNRPAAAMTGTGPRHVGRPGARRARARSRVGGADRCGHAGLINTVRTAQQLTGVERIHTVMGGFHLTGPLFEPRIEPTLEDLADLQPQALIPPSTAPAGRRPTPSPNASPTPSSRTASAPASTSPPPTERIAAARTAVPCRVVRSLRPGTCRQRQCAPTSTPPSSSLGANPANRWRSIGARGSQAQVYSSLAARSSAAGRSRVTRRLATRPSTRARPIAPTTHSTHHTDR